MVLADTSVWIEFFRSVPRTNVHEHFEIDETAICLPVYQEILQGIREEAEYSRVQRALTALPMLESPLRLELFEEASRIYRAARRAGITLRSGVDCLIAACAIRNGIPVIHFDRDFDRIARVTPLAVRSLRPR